MTTQLEWRQEGDSEVAERDGKRLEIRQDAGGRWNLMVWQSTTRSAVIGVYSSPELCKYAAYLTPLRDAAIAALKIEPFGFTGVALK